MNPSGQTTFEAVARSLAQRGFTVDLRVHPPNGGSKPSRVCFYLRVQKGDPLVEQSLTVAGVGSDLDEATRSVLKAGGSFLQDILAPMEIAR